MKTRDVLCRPLLAAAITLGVVIPLDADAATYFVAKTGSNNNTCLQARSSSTAKLTIAAGRACLASGDTLQVRAGTYPETISAPPSGTATARTTIMAFPGETVLVKPSSSVWAIIDWQNSGPQYITVQGLHFDAINANYGVQLLNATHVRFKDCEIHSAKNSGIYLGTSGGSHEFLDLNVHHNGQDWYRGLRASPDAHGVYMQNSNNLIDGGQWHHENSYAIQLFSNKTGALISNNIVRNTRVYANGQTTIPRGGIVVSGGSSGTAENNLVYNNVVYGQINGVGIAVAFGKAINTRIYNNTVHGNSSYGINVGTSSAGAVIRNNIVYANGATPIVNTGTSTISSNNLTTDPSFVDLNTKDFRLRPGSAAIDRGASVSDVATDLTGTARPQGGAYDIGAYEFATIAVVAPPSPPTNVRVLAGTP